MVFGVWYSVFRVWGLGLFGVWRLAVGVECLVCRVWGEEFVV